MAKKQMVMTKVENQSVGHKIGNGILGVFLNAILWIFSFTCIFPLVWMFYSSLKEKREFNANIIGLPENPNFQNYIDVLNSKDSDLIAAMGNSIRTTLISVILIVIFSFICGYILARINFKLNKPLYIMFLMGMLIPTHSLLVPTFIIFSKLNMDNQWFTLLFPNVTFGLPVSLFLVQGYIKGIPSALEEAAAIDGSSFSRTLFSIILPICRPILITVAIIQVFGCWNEFSFALVLLKSNGGWATLPLAMRQFSGQFSTNYPQLMSAMLITMAPVVLFYFIFSKQIIKGMVAGAVKG